MKEKLEQIQDNGIKEAISQILKAKTLIEQKISNKTISPQDQQLTFNILKDIGYASTREHTSSDHSLEDIDNIYTLSDLCDALSNNNIDKLKKIDLKNIESLPEEGLSVLNSIIYPRHGFDDKSCQLKLGVLNDKLKVNTDKKIIFKDNTEAQKALEYLFNEHYEYIDVNEDISLFSNLFSESTQVQDFIESYLAGESL